MKFRLELRNRNFEIKEILDDEYLDLNWSYSRIGGCGEVGFRLPRKRFEERSLTGESNIRIYYRNPDTNLYDLWYQGLIENKVPNVDGNSEEIGVMGHGYIHQLSRVYVSNGAVAQTYVSQEVSIIVKSILDNFIVPVTNVTYNVSDIEATTFTPNNIEFSTNAMSAMQTLAELAGNREWGVDKNRNFFFKARSSSIGFRFLAGTNIKSFQDNQDFSEIVNRLFVQGAQVGGTYHFFGPYTDSSSQIKYNTRTKIIQNSSVTTETVADQLSSGTLEEFKEVSRKASAELVGFGQLGGFNAQMEATTPLDLFAEISKKVKFGQKKFGMFLFSGVVGRLINRINYSLSNNGTLGIRLDLGQLRPNLAEQISQVEYQLEQQRTAAL